MTVTKVNNIVNTLAHTHTPVMTKRRNGTKIKRKGKGSKTMTRNFFAEAEARKRWHKKRREPHHVSSRPLSLFLSLSCYSGCIAPLPFSPEAVPLGSASAAAKMQNGSIVFSSFGSQMAATNLLGLCFSLHKLLLFFSTIFSSFLLFLSFTILFRYNFSTC